MGTADFVSVYLAGVVFGAAVDCDRVHRAGGLRGILLAGAGCGLRAPRSCAAYSMGWDAAGELDRPAGNGGGRIDLFLYRAAALPQHHCYRAAVENIVV